MKQLPNTELLQWLLKNQISIRYGSPMTWTREDGSKYSTNWIVSSSKPSIQYECCETIEETLQQAYNVWFVSKGDK